MKSNPLCPLALLAMLALSAPPAVANEEQDLIAVLQSNAGIPAKAEACKRLRMVGTPISVPALAALLSDERLSHAARYALEGMPSPAAVAAMRQALETSTGGVKAGLIDSLGWRGDAEAVPLLQPLLSQADPAIAAAAASALGRIGGPAAFAILEAAGTRAPREVQAAVVDGLMAAAERFLADGRRAEAMAIYRSLYTPSREDHLRLAAYAGWIRAAGDGALALITSALRADDPAAQTAALRAASEIRDPAAVQAFVEMLPQSPPPLQIALLAVLQERGDPSVIPAVMTAARSPDPTVRIAALGALGEVGDATVLSVIAEAATSTNAVEQAVARESLAILHRGDVTAALVAQVETAPPPVQRELFRALSARAEQSAVPRLLVLARSGQAPTRNGALQVLGSLADGSHMDALVQLLIDGRDSSERDDVRGVFETLVERFGDSAGLDVSAIVKGFSQGDRETRKALFQVGALFVSPRIREAFRTALRDSDPDIRTSSGRAMSATRDAALLPDLLEVARGNPGTSLQSAALEGCVRLGTEDSVALSAQERAAMLAKAFDIATRPEDKRTILAGVSHVPHRTALDLAERACADRALRAEAELACLQIARGLGSPDLAAVEASLSKLALGAINHTVQTNAQALLKSLNSGWVCSGPYRQDGKQGQELFTVAFAPERPGADALPWRRAPGSADLSRIGELDLGGIAAGDHCVVYAKTRLYAPEARAVVFAIGSDDGIQLWLNGERIHANNAVRGLVPDQDRAKGTLRRGWNDLLAKITQHTAGCGMTLRILAEDGTEVPGLRFDALGENQR